MNEFNFLAEVITPLYIGGNDKEPDFSGSSLKGALRFWFRALQGAVLYSSIDSHPKVIEELQKAENKIFGSTSEAGKVFISIDKISGQTEEFSNIINNVNNYSLTYSGYGLQSTNQTLPRKGFSVGSKFNIKIVTNDLSNDKEKMLLDSIFLLSSFGNLGARGSRGFGSVQITTSDKKYRTLGNSIKQSLNSMYNDYSIKVSKITPDFPVISPNSFTVNSFKQRNTGTEKSIIANFGKSLRSFRENNNDPGQRPRTFHSYDYNAVKRGRTTDAPDNIFGLPRNFSFSDYTKAEIAISDGYERRNSPLKFKIIRQNNMLIPMIILFKSAFLPSGVTISVSPRGYNIPRGNLTSPPFTRADDFIKKLIAGGF